MVDHELTVDCSIDLQPNEMSELIGNQMILDGDGGSFAYLAGISFDGMDGDHSPVDILLEFFENEQSFEFTEEQIEDLETILRDAYDD